MTASANSFGIYLCFSSLLGVNVNRLNMQHALHSTLYSNNKRLLTIDKKNKPCTYWIFMHAYDICSEDLPYYAFMKLFWDTYGRNKSWTEFFRRVSFKHCWLTSKRSAIHEVFSHSYFKQPFLFGAWLQKAPGYVYFSRQYYKQSHKSCWCWVWCCSTIV